MEEDIVREIEAELREYPRLRARLEQVEDEIIKSPPSLALLEPERRGRQKGRRVDPTGAAAVKLVEAKRDIEVRVRRVERALSAMTRIQRRLVELYYFEALPRPLVEQELAIERSSFYRIRQAALSVFAFVAGWGGVRRF